MIRIELELGDKSEWTEIFDRQAFAVVVPHTDPPAAGEEVRLDLTVGKGGPRVILRGSVLDRADGEEPGFRLVLGPYEREKVNYLAGFVRGGLLDLRQMRRLPIRLPVTYTTEAGAREAHTRDLNEAGLFIIDENPLPEETDLKLELTVPNRSEPIPLTGRVSHTVVVHDEDIPGMGIRLELSDPARAELRAVVDELEDRFSRGELPEEALT